MRTPVTDALAVIGMAPSGLAAAGHFASVYTCRLGDVGG